MNRFEHGVCVLLPRTGYDVLAVSRRNDPTQWGIPGGKVDPGESNLDAARREIQEECGLYLLPHMLIPLFVGACFGDDGRNYWVNCYLYEGPYGSDWTPEEGFELKVMNLEELGKKSISPFASYNRQVLGAWLRYDLK